MLATSARLLRLLSLLQARRDWTGPELAERLGVTTRTVRNDVDRLRGLGYPVDARRGVAGGYRLAIGSTLPPLLLDDEEAVAVAIGLRTAARGTVAGIEESSVRPWPSSSACCRRGCAGASTPWPRPWWRSRRPAHPSTSTCWCRSRPPAATTSGSASSTSPTTAPRATG